MYQTREHAIASDKIITRCRCTETIWHFGSRTHWCFYSAYWYVNG